MDLDVVRSPYGRFKVCHVDRLLLLPPQDSVKVTALMLIAEVGERHLLDVDPVVQDGFDRRAAR